MSIEHWLAFVVAATVLLVIPGPTVLTVISYSVAHGRRANLPLVVGVALGDATALALSLLGLGALLATSALWFTVIKLVGGLYLLFLGFKLLRSGTAPTLLSATVTPLSHLSLFTNTYLVTALNPKGIVFFVAFLPQFINYDAGIGQQLWLLAATFVTLATLNATAYTVFAASARQMIGSSGAKKGFNLSGGILLITAGIWAIMVRRLP